MHAQPQKPSGVVAPTLTVASFWTNVTKQKLWFAKHQSLELIVVEDVLCSVRVAKPAIFV